MNALVGDKRSRTRDQLLVAAQALLMEHSAGSLGVRQIATAAGLVHGSFYNYYPTVEALIDDLAQLVLASHAALVRVIRRDANGPAETFALITRQTLRCIPDSPGYGRLLFDSGLPIDRFLIGLRLAMRADVAAGAAAGVFKVDDLDLTVSLVIGALLGVSLDLRRGFVPPAAIEAATARMLQQLGLDPAEARRLSLADASFLPAPTLPLKWQTVREKLDA